MTNPQRTWPEMWADLRIVALDVETTGFDPEEERIIEIGLVTFEGGELVESWGSLFDPGKPIPPEVIELTGISDEDVEGKPRFEELAEEVLERLTGVGLCAYNIAFDRSFVDAELGRCGLGWPSDAPTFDPLIIAREYQREHNRHGLEKVAERLDITLENAHRAVDDADVAGQILYAFAPQLPDRLVDILVLQTQWQRQQESTGAHWLRGNKGPGLNLDAVAGVGAQAVGLGPAYIYGEELDPLRAIYLSVPQLQRE